MSRRTTVAIIWAGFAWLSAYLQLRKRLGKKVDIKIFDMRDKFTYTPWLHACIWKYTYLEWLQFEYKKYYGEDFINQEVTKITKQHKLHTKDGEERSYDYAIIATWSRTDYFWNDSFEDKAFTIRHPEDICPLNRALENAETISVIGGWFTGVEVVSVAAMRYPNKKIRIIHSRDRILNNMNERTSRLATKWLLDHNVQLILNDKVKEICVKSLTLDSGTKLDSDVTILVSWITPNDELHDEEITFAQAYKSLESEHILICGDASSFGLYTTAHNAMIEWRRMGNLIADKEKKITRKYKPLENRPFLALALGTHDGIFTTPKHCIRVPWVTWIAKRFVEQRVLIEFKYKIMLPV